MRRSLRVMAAMCALVAVVVRAAPPPMDATTRAALKARIDAWEALTPQSRRDARAQMQSWLLLPPTQQAALRESAAAFAALGGEEQAALREKFDALPGEQQRGWRLGAALGPYYLRLHPLIAYVPEDERLPLLRVLQSMPPQELEVLGRVAFSTPPGQRDALRQALIRQPAPDRLRWLLTELDR